MKVSKCSDNKAPAIPTAPALLRFEDIIKKEGVYVLYYSGVKASIRFLVLKTPNTAVVLYYNGTELGPANFKIWSLPECIYELDKTAEVCFEIRSKA